MSKDFALKEAAYNKINDALSLLLCFNRFYYYIVSNIKIKSDSKIKTLAVGFESQKAKSLSMRYNPDFICNFSYDNGKEEIAYNFTNAELKSLIIHEVLHVCLRHLFNVESYPDKELLNWAQDIIVNDILFRNEDAYINNVKSKKGDRPALHELLVTKNAFPETEKMNISEHTFGEIYSTLYQYAQKNPQGMQGMKDAIASGKKIQDDHDSAQPGNGEQEKESEKATGSGKKQMSEGEMQAMIKHLLNNAAKQNFDRGDLPAELLKELDLLVEKPDFRETLDHFVKNARTDTNVSTWKRPSRRFGNIARGKTADFKPKILLGIDSSGSVFSHPKALEKIQLYFNFAVDHLEKLTLIYCDTEIHLNKQFEKGETIPDIRGGGGSVMQPIFDNAAEEEFDGTVFITDGYVAPLDTKGVSHICLIVPGGVCPPGIDSNKCIFLDES